MKRASVELGHTEHTRSFLSVCKRSLTQNLIEAHHARPISPPLGRPRRSEHPHDEEEAEQRSSIATKPARLWDSRTRGERAKEERIVG